MEEEEEPRGVTPQAFADTVCNNHAHHMPMQSIWLVMNRAHVGKQDKLRTMSTTPNTHWVHRTKGVGSLRSGWIKRREYKARKGNCLKKLHPMNGICSRVRRNGCSDAGLKLVHY